ncbi:NAD(P)H-dependent glycerol-3-phosphate dehydrogenase [Tunicatimonas pelagia]|uniref:NAD(P)H-dependent glycerol-3-phosphate dehydrogenase n=1 Tax=Tunicatimonas pelagia TaxID=931531 RepID=UPI0026654D09|nr:NAD(P)H-dependent glycerol-3-phosphate dehydrogenase [Tunicatimonas pelagia]WKN41412.1 NAD(P)-dependent glycerol-3-phosphate dehydrogenase [Tunicatimonas pelagia]
MPQNSPVGVIGAGSFGTVVANLLAENSDVLLYARRPEVVAQINQERQSAGYALHPRVRATNDAESTLSECSVLFPIVASSGFRETMRSLSAFLRPYHIVIHGTKGLDALPSSASSAPITRKQIKTMSEVIREETVAVRIGCLAGPNLAHELGEGQPGATVVASRFDEVIQTGQRLLRNDLFQVYGSDDLIGIELCGILKNIIAIASGALSGLSLGENARALLVSRGLLEMITIGKALGGNTEAFMGVAGVGDLVATCSSTHSRNYTVGYRLAQGETLGEVVRDMEEVAEGVNTTRIVKQLADYHQIPAPITRMLYRMLFEDLPAQRALQGLMKIPLGEGEDVNVL